VLVMSNFGWLSDLRIMGIPVGEVLDRRYAAVPKRRHAYGSIIAVVATDAPLLPHQITRICKRVALGIGRAGSYAFHESGEIVVGFSTANMVPRTTKKMLAKVSFLLDPRMNPLYRAAVDATEESILNALCMANDMTGVNGHFAPALPLDEVRAILERYHHLP